MACHYGVIQVACKCNIAFHTHDTKRMMYNGSMEGCQLNNILKL